MDLFEHAAAKDPRRAPLADRMRPRNLDEVVGQIHLVGHRGALRRLVASGTLPSLLLWGPPGVGKTTLAHVLAHCLDSEFETLSAVMSGVKEIREVVGRAQRRYQTDRRRTVLFIDEIHRFNKGQQDALLPHVERGNVTLIGATTENPSFEVNAALLSRTKVFVLEAIDSEALAELLQRALADEERGLGGKSLTATDEALNAIIGHAQGDARRALNALETAHALAAQGRAGTIELEHVEDALQHKSLLYDKAGEEHFSVISAFIKSLRGSDPDAALYWMVRMLESGEDPKFILRRMVIFASEDIGNADPQALSVATNALQAFNFIGLPEGVLPMSQAATYLATAPKSNASYAAYLAVRKEVRSSGSLPVPTKLRNASNSMAKKLGHGRDYKYPHNFDGHYVAENYLPEPLAGHRYYKPSDQGYERTLALRMSERRGDASDTDDTQ